MKIAVDGVVLPIQPDSADWERPLLGHRGDGSAVYGSYYTCRLGFSTSVEAYFRPILDNADSASHTLVLPHPSKGVLTEYTGVFIDEYAPRLDTSGPCAIVTGADVTLTHITVT